MNHNFLFDLSHRNGDSPPFAAS